MQILNSIKFQSIRHDNDFMRDNKNVQKSWSDDLCCSEFLCETLTIFYRVLGRASRGGWRPLGWTRTEYVKQEFLIVKGNWNKSNERKIHSHLTQCAQTVFLGVKVSVSTVSNCIFLIFLKKVIKSTVCTTEGLGWCNCIFTISTVSLLLFVSFLLKIHYF